MSHTEPDPFLPSVSRGAPASLPEKLEPLSLLHPLDADLWLRVDGEGRLRVARGELLVLRGAHAALLDRRRAAGEVLLFHAGWPWLGSALAALGLDPRQAAQAVTPVCVEAAGSDLARRTARLLAGAHLEPDRSRAASRRLQDAARWLDLIAAAFAVRGGLDAGRGPLRGVRRSAFLDAVEALGSQPLEECTLPGFADRLGISERHASRLFREWIGTSFQEHVAGLRLERAKRLLATTDLSITEVAMEAGWRSLSHFNSVFRRRTALTPGAYRSTTSPRDLIEFPPPVDPT
jgi:AraC-like DNA-binding protein